MNFEERLEWLEKEYIPACKEAGALVSYEILDNSDELPEWVSTKDGFPDISNNNVSFRVLKQEKITIVVNGVQYTLVPPMSGRLLPDGECWRVSEESFLPKKAHEKSRGRSNNKSYFTQLEDAEIWAKVQKSIRRMRLY